MKRMILVLVALIVLSGCSAQQVNDQLAKLNTDFDSVKGELEQMKNQLTEEFDVENIEQAVEKYKLSQDDLAKLKEESESTISALNDEVTELKNKITTLNKEATTPTNRPQSQNGQNLLVTALDVVILLKNQDYQTIANEYIDSSQGVTFSPMPFIDTYSDIWFGPAEFANLANDTWVYTWTTNTPSGDPVALDFANYYQQYVFDHDYTNPQLIGNNQLIGEGNMIANYNDVYPGSSFVEFHFTGFDPANDGMDWKSLRLHFKEIGGEWKLININHAQWTP